MNAENKITIKHVSIYEPGLTSVMSGAIGNPLSTKVLKVIKSYGAIEHEIIAAFMGNILSEL